MRGDGAQKITPTQYTKGDAALATCAGDLRGDGGKKVTLGFATPKRKCVRDLEVLTCASYSSAEVGMRNYHDICGLGAM